ncbi:MAG: hypothetical protein U0694_00700 [Anaerolineae bacterium]
MAGISGHEQCGLLEIPEAGNWMNLVAVRYNTLYDNASRSTTRRCWPMTGCNSRCRRALPAHHNSVNAAQIHERLNLLMWIDRCWVAEHFAEHLERLKAIRLEWFMLYHNIGTISSRPYYLPWSRLPGVRRLVRYARQFAGHSHRYRGLSSQRTHPALHVSSGHR